MSVAGSEGIITPGGLPESAFPRVLGIDPGITGGLALFVAGSGTIDARDIPTADGEVDVATLTAILREWSPTVAYVERAQAMPDGHRGRRQGAQSTFKYGAAYGALQAACTCLGIPLHRVSPSHWKKRYAITGETDAERKERSRALALRLWPGAGCFARKKDHGRAEAALIARFGWEAGR